MPPSSPLLSTSSWARSSVHERAAAARRASMAGTSVAAEDGARRERHDHVETGQHGLGHPHRASRPAVPPESVDQDRLDAPRRARS